MAPAVSIITVYYNTPAELQKLYRSLREHLPPDLYEWIVVDNHSLEDLSSVLADVTYIRLPENIGFGPACNAGAQKAQGEALFFVNPDCELVHDCLSPLLAAMKHAAIAGPQVLRSDRLLQASFGPYLSLWNEAKQRTITRYEASHAVQKRLASQGTRVLYPDYVSGCALMIRAGLFHELGGFDEDYFLYNEDVDLCLRARQRGARILYVPSARIVHVRNTSVSREPARAAAEYRRSQVLFYRKHRSRLAVLFLKVYLSLKFILQWSMLKVVWRV